MRNASAPASFARSAACKWLKTSTNIPLVSGFDLIASTEAETIQLRHQYLGDQDLWSQFPGACQRRLTVVGKLDAETSVLQKIALEALDHGVSLDYQDQRTLILFGHTWGDGFWKHGFGNATANL